MLFHMWYPDCQFCHRRQGNNFTPKKGVKAARKFSPAQGEAPMDQGLEEQ